ncbi:MAG: DUF4864 domain-containing protein [Pseudomonadota bacterium]
MLSYASHTTSSRARTTTKNTDQSGLNRRTAMLGMLGAAASFVFIDRALAMDAEERCAKVVESQLNAFIRKDYKGAYAHAAPVIQRMYPNSEVFAQMVSRGYGAVYDPASFALGRAMERDGQRVQEVFITDKAGVGWVALYSLGEYDGEFRITGVFLQKGGSST